MPPSGFYIRTAELEDVDTILQLVIALVSYYIFLDRSCMYRVRRPITNVRQRTRKNPTP